MYGPNTKVDVGDERIKELCRRFPSITFEAASEIAVMLAYAEDKGRAYAAIHLTEEFEAAKKLGAEEKWKSVRGHVWSAQSMMNAVKTLVGEYEDFKASEAAREGNGDE